MTGSDVCALNLQSQLMGEIEEFGMRRVVGHSPTGQDAAGVCHVASWAPEGGSGHHIPGQGRECLWLAGRWANPAGPKLAPFGCL